MAKKIIQGKIIKGKKPPSSLEGVPEEEITLAQLIQNAAARGLHSVRGGLYGKLTTEKGYSKWAELYTGEGIDGETNLPIFAAIPTRVMHKDQTTPGKLRKPPKGATCACALGAQLLTPAVTNPVTMTVAVGNDHSDDTRVGSQTKVYTWEDERSLQIGMAYEHALRPSQTEVKALRKRSFGVLSSK